jgi:hypothetical protein
MLLDFRLFVLKMYAFPSKQFCWPVQSKQYSDLLQTGRCWDRIPVGVRYSAPVETGPGDHTASCTMSAGSLSRRQWGRGVVLTTHHHLAPRLNKESYTSTPPPELHGGL